LIHRQYFLRALFKQGLNQSLLTHWATLTGPTARKGGIALIDQGVVSGTNFLTGFLLARLCSQEEYGAYVLAFSILLFVNGLQFALVTGPMMVLGAPKEGEEMKGFFSALGAVQGLIGLALAVVAISAALVIGAFDGSNESFRAALLGMGVALFFIQAQEFFRRLLFTKLLTHRVLLNDIIYSGLLLAGLFFLWRTGGGTWSPGTPGYLSGGSVLSCIGAAALFASVLGLLQCKGFLAPALVGTKKHLQETWKFGKWGLLGLAGGTATIQANTWIIGGLGGQVSVASVEAPRLILAPLQIFMFGLANVFTPRAAGVYSHDGERGLLGFLKRAMVPWIVLLVVFGSSMILFGKTILDYMFGLKYSEQFPLLILWTAIYITIGLRQVHGYGLTAIKRPDLGVRVSLVVGSLTLLLTGVLMVQGGITLALSARLIGELISLAILSYFLDKYVVRKVNRLKPLPMREGGDP
jgi:O-antigen/teichoic acid export membrane protein